MPEPEHVLVFGSEHVLGRLLRPNSSIRTWSMPWTSMVSLT